MRFGPRRKPEVAQAIASAEFIVRSIVEAKISRLGDYVISRYGSTNVDTTDYAKAIHVAMSSATVVCLEDPQVAFLELKRYWKVVQELKAKGLIEEDSVADERRYVFVSASFLEVWTKNTPRNRDSDVVTSVETFVQNHRDARFFGGVELIAYLERGLRTEEEHLSFLKDRNSRRQSVFSIVFAVASFLVSVASTFVSWVSFSQNTKERDVVIREMPSAFPPLTVRIEEGVPVHVVVDNAPEVAKRVKSPIQTSEK